MKRFLYIILSFVVLLTTVLSVSASASNSELDSITTPNIVLYEANSGTILYSRNETQRAYPASTTKIMTCILALEHFEDLSQTYTCGSEATDGFGSQSSLLGLRSGYVMTIRDMLYGLMLVSGNDCGACLAVAVAGSNSAFIDMMNAKAAEIGMTSTHYTNAHGLQNEDHYTTAYDMALLMSYCLKNSDFRAIIKRTSYTVQEQNGLFSREIFTSNKHLYRKDTDTQDNRYAYSIGGKTGETNAAGYCLVTAAEKDGVTLVAVLLGDNNQGGTTTYYRFQNAAKMFDWGFNNFVSYSLSQLNAPTEFNVNTTGYDLNDPNNGVVSAVADVSGVYVSGAVTEFGQTPEASISHELNIDDEAIVAPVEIGTIVGTVSYYFAGRLVHTADLTATSGVNAEVVETEAPYATNFISVTPAPGSEKHSNLTISKNGGEPQYTVWVYYQESLYTMQEGTTWHYLYCDDEVYRASTLPNPQSKILLYQSVTDEYGNVSYVLAQSVTDGASYVIVSNGMALAAERSGRSLEARSLEFDGAGNIVTPITGELIWRFSAKGNGYQLISNGYYLHRSAGDGLLFWILIVLIAIIIIIVIRIIVTKKYRRRNPKRRGKYKVYKV